MQLSVRILNEKSRLMGDAENCKEGGVMKLLIMYG